VRWRERFPTREVTEGRERLGHSATGRKDDRFVSVAPGRPCLTIAVYSPA